MGELERYDAQTFEEIKHYTDKGVEFWLARELQIVLEYTQWRNFEAVIDKAKMACENSKNDVSDHFADVSKTILMPKNASKEIDDIALSRYACYLIV